MKPAATIETDALLEYLRTRHLGCDVRLLGLAPLGASAQAELKDYGYGRPLRITYEAGGVTRDVVFRTMSPDPFGHDRRADRAQVLLDAYETFARVPGHVRPLDVGTVDAQGVPRSFEPGEPFLLTDYVTGRLYADDLREAARRGSARPLDLSRAATLAGYLAGLHAEAAAPSAHRRAVRDMIGSGEGIFGICDSYPPDSVVSPPRRLRDIERKAVMWRWRLQKHARRARRTHGDFHPFNLLFREGSDFSVLDCSRGGAGDPADDVTCLSINYLFFTLAYCDSGKAAFTGPLRELWEVFWATYLQETGDRQLLAVAAPFFAWRALVVASPAWYPNVSNVVRNRLIRFAERLLDGERFEPHAVESLL